MEILEYLRFVILAGAIGIGVLFFWTLFLFRFLDWTFIEIAKIGIFRG